MLRDRFLFRVDAERARPKACTVVIFAPFVVRADEAPVPKNLPRRPIKALDLALAGRTRQVPRGSSDVACTCAPSISPNNLSELPPTHPDARVAHEARAGTIDKAHAIRLRAASAGVLVATNQLSIPIARTSSLVATVAE